MQIFSKIKNIVCFLTGIHHRVFKKYFRTTPYPHMLLITVLTLFSSPCFIKFAITLRDFSIMEYNLSGLETKT